MAERNPTYKMHAKLHTSFQELLKLEIIAYKSEHKYGILRKSKPNREKEQPYTG